MIFCIKYIGQSASRPHESPELQLQWVELGRLYAIRVICVRNGSVEFCSSSWKHKYLKVLDLLDFEKRSR